MVLGRGMIGSRAARRSGLLLYAAANCQREQFQNNSRRAFALGVKLRNCSCKKTHHIR